MYLHPELGSCQLPLAQGPHFDTAASDRLNLTDTFPRPAPNWCPWHILSGAGVCLGALQYTQKPLKLPDFLSLCPLSNPLQPLGRHQSWVERIHSGARPRGCIPSLRKVPVCLFAWRGLQLPHTDPFSVPLLMWGRGAAAALSLDGVKAGRTGQTAVVARPQGNKWRFLLPYPTLQESRVTSFPPGEDCTAVLPWGSPAPKNLPCCSRASKGFTPHQEQRIWDPAIPGSEFSLKVPEGWRREIQMHGNTDG